MINDVSANIIVIINDLEWREIYSPKYIQIVLKNFCIISLFIRFQGRLCISYIFNQLVNYTLSSVFFVNLRNF